ncbi:UpxY family transcription antiterminator [Aquimarina sediminis]|uniref:UpxY family transcription antiterminator n=1 Tax=Aquimarina sediminis TaxID=2070536 RepID=UPI000CA04202|nr:UpxY family transcription antiterminator [Aquimarina sediminis]
MLKTLKTGWHVLYVRSRHEKKVHSLLEENQLESFLPMIRTISQWTDRQKIILKPLFPSYVFVKINSIKDFNKALTINGVCSYVRCGGEYAKLKDEEINNIRLVVDVEDITDLEMNTQNYEAGEVKKIFCGPLIGLECEILKYKNRHKILVRIDSIPQNITATIPSHYLQ